MESLWVKKESFKRMITIQVITMINFKSLMTKDKKDDLINVFLFI
jgi:hypothetical protein